MCLCKDLANFKCGWFVNTYNLLLMSVKHLKFAKSLQKDIILMTKTQGTQLTMLYSCISLIYVCARKSIKLKIYLNTIKIVKHLKLPKSLPKYIILMTKTQGTLLARLYVCISLIKGARANKQLPVTSDLCKPASSVVRSV